MKTFNVIAYMCVVITLCYTIITLINEFVSQCSHIINQTGGGANVAKGFFIVLLFVFLMIFTVEGRIKG